jgi:hypothetical protein
MYREDDDNFKRRLNTAIQMSWVYNTALTILALAIIFYILDLNMVMGIILGVLGAMLSNLHLTLSRVTRASRWEIYKNRVVMPQGFRGGDRTIHFKDIDTIERERKLTGELVMITLKSDELLTFDAEEQEKPLAALELVFRQYGRSHVGPMREIRLPIKKDAPSVEETEGTAKEI